MRLLLLALFLCVSSTPVQAIAAESSERDNAALRQLLVICRDLGRDTTLGQLQKLAPPHPEGMTLSHLARVAIGAGLHAEVVKIGADRIAGIPLPVIACLWDDRLVTVRSAGNGALLLSGDGAVRQQMSAREFTKIHTGWSLLVAQDHALFSEYDLHGPQVAFDHHRFNFWQVEEGGEIRHAFEFTNAGTSELVISDAHASCGCTTALVMDSRVPPGGSSAVLVTFDSTGRLGFQSYEIYVSSNDAVTPFARLEMGGIVLPRNVLVSPRRVEFGNVPKGSGGRREVYLFDPGHSDLEVIAVECNSPFITTTVESLRTDELFPRYRLTVKMSEQAPLGELRAKLTIFTNHPREPIVEIPVAATIKAELAFHPGILFLGIVKRGQECRGSVLLSTSAPEPLKIGKIDNPLDHVSVEITPQVQGKEYLITAILKGTAPAGAIKGEIVVHTNDPDEPRLRVPVRGLVEDREEGTTD